MFRIGVGPRDYGSINCFEGVQSSNFEFIRKPSLTWRPLSKWVRSLKNISDSAIYFLPSSCQVDLFHTFNLAVANKKPWVCSFESLMPRAWASEAYHEKILKMMASDHCKSLLALSENAKLHALERNRHSPYLSLLEHKIQVVYPGIEDISASFTGIKKDYEGSLKVIFVGNDFFRKGGHFACMAVEALKKTTPVEATFISTMSEYNYMEKVVVGDGVKWKKRILENGFLHFENVSSKIVAEKISQAHVLLLPTMDDSFGYSILEAMRSKTLAIATRIRAIPEMITHEVNGLLLDLPVTSERRLDMAKFDQAKLINDLVSSLRACAKNRAYVNIIAQEAHQHFGLHFSKASLEKKLSSIYARAIAGV